MSGPLSLSDLSQRLFSKPPSLQNVTGEQVARYLNAPVCDVGEDLISQLLHTEHCTNSKDQKEFNEYVTTGTLLHLLAFVGRHDAMKWLLDSGAHPHILNHSGSTPLHVAAVRHHPEAIKALRLHHADAYTENKDGKTAIDVGSEADDVKEALLAYRFSGEEMEDEFLQERIPVLVERVTDSKCSQEDQMHCLLSLRAEMRMATSSMTSVPKPLKLLREFYPRLEEAYEKMATCPSKAVLADVLSVQAMAMEDKERKILCYRLKGSQEKISSFGHPYVRRLCAEVPEQWSNETSPEDTLLELVRKLAVFCLEHSAESEACDMLMEIEKIELLLELVTEDVHERVCLYLTSCVKYVPEPEDSILLHTALKVYRQFKRYPQALRLALMLNDMDLTKEIFVECPDDLQRKQLAFMLGRQQVFLTLEDKDCPNSEDLSDIMSNVHLNTNFLALGRELDIMEPKVPEDIYKTHLEHSRFSTANTVDSARANLAASFVNGFVNTAFGEDKLMSDTKWIYKNKGAGMFSATASLGLILLWDVEGGLTQIDKLLYSGEDYIKAGALMACGIVNVGVRNDIDPALALCVDYIMHDSSTMRLGAIIGLGLAYAGSYREDVESDIAQVLWDASTTFEVVCLGALSCAMIFVGTCHGETSANILQLMMERDPADLVKTPARYLALALALLYLGKQEAVDATVEALKVLPEPFCTFSTTLLKICAYAGTGNVLKIQQLLHTCSEFHGNKEPEEEEGAESDSAPKESSDPKESSNDNSTGKEGTTGGGAKDTPKGGEAKDTPKKAEAAKPGKDVDMKDASEAPEPGSLSEAGAHQAVSVLGIALIAMGEDIGAEMALRTFNQLLHYGDPVIRRAVPLALSLLSTSNPQLPILDTLGKLSHDSDPSVARNAIFAMGLVGSGTNNARLAGMLRNLAQFYHKEPLDLFMVRLAQGLTHLGKGTLTLNAYHSDRMLMTPVAVAGILAVLVSMLDASNIILRDSHYMLYFLTLAIQPRMLVTFGEDLSPLPVTVRVGQAVDVVGQAGKPKTITGFQTHTTPVLLAYGERAELATEEYVTITPIVEGFVILKKNPDYIE